MNVARMPVMSAADTPPGRAAAVAGSPLTQVPPTNASICTRSAPGGKVTPVKSTKSTASKKSLSWSVTCSCLADILPVLTIVRSTVEYCGGSPGTKRGSCDGVMDLFSEALALAGPVVMSAEQDDPPALKKKGMPVEMQLLKVMSSGVPGRRCVVMSMLTVVSGGASPSTRTRTPVARSSNAVSLAS